MASSCADIARKSDVAIAVIWQVTEELDYVAQIYDKNIQGKI